MRAKDFLWQLKDVNKLIETLDEEHQRLMDKATDISVKYSDVILRTGETSSKQERTVLEMVELADEMKAAVEKMRRIEKKAMTVIEKIEPLRLRTVLIKYYIQNKTFEQTAVEMELTYRWVCELHGQALAQFDQITGGKI